MRSITFLALLYKGHLRARPLPELLALVGIAAGVALLFAVQVANKSVTGSVEQVAGGIAGRASLEVAARAPQGFDQGLFRKVKRLPDVKAAAPVIERRIAVRGPKGRRALTLVGFDDRLTRLGGNMVKRFASRRETTDLGLYLTEPTARAIGVGRGDTVKVEVGESTKRIPLAGAIAEDEIGSLAQSPVAVAHLGLAQEIASMPERITRVLVAPQPGKEAKAKSDLKKLSAGKLNVRPSDTEVKLLNTAAAADRQSSAIFSVISLVVGILLAYNAMLLTISARRRVVASLDMLGASSKTIVASLFFDALILGLAGSLLGILFGDLLSRYVMHQIPGYLSAAFAIGGQRVVDFQTIFLSIAGGTLAALAAAAQPALSLLRVGPLAALSERGREPAETYSSTVRKWSLFGGIALVALFVCFSLLLPESTLVGVAVLVLAIVLILPSLIGCLLTLAHRLARRTGSAALRISVGELAANPIRATALAAVGALAVFAIVGITGPSLDIQRGVRQLAVDGFGGADIWVSPRLEESPFITHQFDQEPVVSRMHRLPEVESVRPYHATFLDVGGRRLHIIGRSGTAPSPIPPSQIIDGDASPAMYRFRQGGWAALTSTLARERNIKIGQKFSLPTPSGNRYFKLAATITNYGWPSGTLVINARDYMASWKTRQVGAMEVVLAKGVTFVAGKSALQRALGKNSVLAVRTVEENVTVNSATTRQGLARLDQIADMVLVAAVLAVAAAMLGSIWQRRQRFWGLVSLGMGFRQLYQTIFLETGVILLFGCLIGAAFGFFGQVFADRWLHLTTAYPVAFEPAFGLALRTLALTTGLVVMAAALPIRFVFSTRRVIALTAE